MQSIKIVIDKISYHNSEEINISVDLNKTKIETNNLTNVNININELGQKRNELKLGFGANPKIDNKKISISRKLTDSLKDGIYFIGVVKLIYGQPEEESYHEISLFPEKNFEIKFFHIHHEKDNSYSASEIKKKIKQISKNRADYRNKTIISASALNQKNVKEFKVLIFGIGCLIHTVQELSGYTIYPIKSGLEYSNLNNAVNQFLLQKYKFQLPFNNQINEDFKRSTPLFVIDYEYVKAINNFDASSHCSSISNSIFSILGFKKGQRPNIFASVIIEKGKPNYSYNFQFPGYKGNLVSEFSPTATANLIDKLYPIISTNPWMKLIIDSHSNALNEDNIDLKYFRFWAILELIAKKEISENNLELLYADKTPIKNNKGDILKTDSALRKVYYFVYNSNLQKSTSSCSVPGYEFNFLFEMNEVEKTVEGTEKIVLWETLNAVYAIRNAAAHQGKFIIEDAKKGDWKDKIAAKLYPLKFNILLEQLEQIVNKIIEKQINNFA